MIPTSVILFVILSQCQIWASTIPTPTPSSSDDSYSTPTSSSSYLSPTPSPSPTTSISLEGYIQSLLDPKVNACESLYGLACGNYENSSSDYWQNNMMIIKNIVTVPITDDDTKAQKLFKTYYTSCMDTETLNVKKYEPVKKILDNFEWPWIKNDWDESSFSWSEAQIKLKEIGDSADEFVEITVKTDFKDSTKNTITIDTPSFPTNSAILRLGEGDEEVKKFQKQMIDVLKLYGIEASKIDSDIAEVVKFMSNLAKIVDKTAQLDASDQYNPITIGELEKKSEKDINWQEFINKMIKNANTDASTTINVTLGSFLDAFIKLIDETPKKVQANYLFSSLVYSYMYMTTDAARKIIDDSEPGDRSTTCVSYVVSLSVGIDSVFVKENVDERTIPMVTEIAESIQAELAELIRQADWLEDSVKQKAVEKVEAIIFFIGYSKELQDESKVDAYYESLYDQLSATEFIENCLKINKFHFNEVDSLYGQTNDRTVMPLSDYSLYSTTGSSVYYMTKKVVVVVPSSMLLHPRFGVDYPTSMNYGGIGYYIASVMAYTFKGNDKFDASGSINPIWTDEAKAKYEEKTKCLQDQYSCIVVDKNINLDGAKTNILDVRELVGVKILYLAFQKVANKNEASLPGLSYTTNQLFWIAYAKEKCETKNNDGTTPAIYLVDQTVANLEQFSNDFGCKEGDKLYLKDRCTIV